MTRILTLVFCCLFLSAQSVCASPFGVTLTAPIITRVPDNLHGGRAAIWYQIPYVFSYQFPIYIDASYAVWRVSGACANRSITVYSIAPYLRYYFGFSNVLSPFVEISVGPAYLNKTRLEKRNLGMHMSFQDQLRLGADFGRTRQISVSLAFLHYSNARLCEHNSGITIPVTLNVSYQF